MTDDTKRAIWKTYQAAWAPVSDAERRALLARSVAADVRYSDPAGSAEGIEALVAYIATFQQKFAGARFENDSFLKHHDQAFATWRRLDGDGDGEALGRSYARFGADGLIEHLAGFPRAWAGEAGVDLWNTYQAAWRAIADAERRRLLAESVAPDAIYSDPTDYCRGLDELIHHIEGSQAKVPGATFHNDAYQRFGQQLLSDWTMRNGDGSVVATGTSYACFGGDGLLARMTGFFERP